MKFKNINCNVSLKSKLQVELYKFILWIRRIINILNRLRKNNKEIKYVTICIIAYAILIFIFGKLYIKNEYNIWDVLWETKSEILTAMVISFFLYTTKKVEEWKKNLINRHEYYTDIMWEFEREINEIYKKIMDIDYRGSVFDFYTSTSIMKLVNALDNILFNNMAKKNYDTNVQYIATRVSKLYKYSKRLNKNLKKIYIDDDFYYYTVGYKENILLKEINYLINSMQQLKSEMNTYRDFIRNLKSVLLDIERVLRILRKPWRKDYDIDFKIYDILYKENPKIILEDYYADKRLGLSERIMNNERIESFLQKC